MPLSSSRASLALIALSSSLLPSILSCQGPREEPLLPRAQTWAELRTVRRSVTVAPPDEAARAPYPRERIVDGEVIKVDAEGLAWLRRDGGATLLIHGPAQLTVRSGTIDIQEGRVFVDTPIGVTAELTTPSGPLHLAQVRASIDVHANAATEAYVLAGEVRTDGKGRALAGEQLVITGKPGATKATTSPALTWEDWTGGLATTDRAAEPSPYGVGTVGARRPGDQGAPRSPLSIQKLDVKVKIEQDFAVTEVDEIFFNPSSDVVEGVYRFRTPDGATLHRFGVDRDGVIVWGRVKEKQAAAAQYQANVYQGSTEDPALLEWDAPGVYRARLYPIGPGESRRVVVRYAEWLGRNGPKGERRLYVYPMAAEGAEASLPHIEELYATIDLSKASAKEIRVGMAGVRDGTTLVVREHDFVPRADLAVELFDDSPTTPRGYTAPHVVDVESLPSTERAEALRQAKTEADYLLVPVRPSAAPPAKSGLDLAVVVDTSAATEASSLAVARAATAALLAHLGKEDRVVVWAGDTSLWPVVPSRDTLKPIEEAGRQEIMTRLAGIQRGGATDLGAMLSQAAAALDPSRRSAIVYIGDGSPTVGELALADLEARLAKLPRPARIFALGVGDGADMAILKGLSRGAFAERIGDANAAARAALRLLETAERPVWLGASIDLGPNVERIFPRDLGALVADSSLVVIGRLTGEGRPTSITLNTASGSEKLPLEVTSIEDQGDLRRRWAEGRLAQMLDENTGRAAMVDLGSRHGIITPVTSLYVPTKNEMTAEERSELERARLDHRDRSRSSATSSESYRDKQERKAEKDRSWSRRAEKAQAEAEVVAENNADNKEGGTGTRAKGEEGSMGNPNSRATGNRYGVAGPSGDAAPQAARAAALRDAAEFGMIGLAAAPAATAPAASAPGAAATSIASDALKTIAPAPPAVAERELEVAPAAMARAPAPQKQALASGGKSAEKKPDGQTESSDMPFHMAMPTTPAAKPMDGEDGRAQAATGEQMEQGAVGNLWGADIRGGGGPDVSGKAELSKGPVGGIAGGVVGGDVGGEGGGEGFGNGHGRLGGRHRESTIDTTTAMAGDGKFKEKDSKIANERRDEGGFFAQPGAGFRTSIAVRIGDVPHVALRCGNAAFVPFEERIQLWRERLAPAIGNPAAAANVYRRALFACEAPTFRERSKLLSLLLDAMPAVRAKVALWRVLFRDLGAADTLYRSILARVRTPAEARELHDALGLKSIDPGVLARLLKAAKSPADRVNRLRALVSEWPDDFALSLRLLDALEDTGDDPGARAFGNRLRARPDADARLRTAVGELYLRLATRAPTPEQKALDEGEARRAFGEIVEYAPDDPVARRRLGDLLRAHGWFADATRQYETLARLAPDDATVPLLLAAAAEGQGKLEEAVKWTEKGGAAGAPDAAESPARTARAFAATYLAWGRKAALEAGRADEAKALAARLARVLSTERTSSEALRGTRVALTWAHPELHPTLWNNALGALMPAPYGDITLGIAQAIMPERDTAMIEVRIEPEDLEHVARLGAEATLTAVFDEGSAGEKIVKVPLKFEREPTLRFSIAGGAVREVRP